MAYENEHSITQTRVALIFRATGSNPLLYHINANLLGADLSTVDFNCADVQGSG